MQEKKCDEGETAGNYRDLKGRVDTLTRNYQKLESDLGNAAVSKLNTTLNAVDGVADDLDACKCSEIDLLVLESATNNPLTNSIQKALCYVICGISVALGRFACMIVGYVIDPIMGDEEAGTSTKRSCNPTFTSSSSSSSGGSAAADGGGGAPGKGTNPAPTATNVEGGDDGESGDDPGPRATVAE
ncbi:hypothetical protein HY523_00210 [Candidatus Berkelbacteria bacterium]|nr:hypothetical protein [Candidatus Berkelbacteria bacterium]